MAFLHCYGCGWQQDDFWDERYNPLRMLLRLEEDLLCKPLDQEAGLDPGFVERTGARTNRELILYNMKTAVAIVETMMWRTSEEWDRDGDPSCPGCGEPLDID